MADIREIRGCGKLGQLYMYEQLEPPTEVLRLHPPVPNGSPYFLLSKEDQKAFDIAYRSLHRDRYTMRDTFWRPCVSSDAEPQEPLGFIYANDPNSPQKTEQVLYLLGLAAMQGSGKAQYNLGMFYYLGEGGVEKDYKSAASWFRKAALLRNPYAQYWFGMCCYFGQGVSLNREKAGSWFRKAADQGLVEAQFKIGLCYFLGDGVPKEYAEADKWFNLASLQDGNQFSLYQFSISEKTGLRFSK